MIRSLKSSPCHDTVNPCAAGDHATQQNVDGGVSVDVPGGSRTSRTPLPSRQRHARFDVASHIGRETQPLASVGQSRARHEYGIVVAYKLINQLRSYRRVPAQNSALKGW